jgi:glycosyltransferase involved in cell wall biosynthesis
MKILLLSTHLNLGGIGIYVLSQALGLVERGHKVWVASCGGDLETLLEAGGAEHIKVDIKTKSELSLKVFLAQRQIVSIIKEKDIQLIHAHTRVTQVLAHLVSKKTRAPFVTTCHGFFKPRLFRKAFPCWGARCIAISEAVRAHLVNDLGLRKEKVVVVHNGVQIEKFSCDKFNQAQKDKFKQDYGLMPGVPIIGTIARLSCVKGQCYLISAMKEILKDCPSAQLLLVGAGPEKHRLMNQAKELGIEDRVVFSPSTLDTSVPLSIMDIFVFPSVMEGLGLAIIEAQAMGLPVVASDVGGIYTLVKDGINGFLVPAKEPEALAETVLRLLKDKKLANAMGKQAREQARQHFNLKEMIEGIERVYMTVTSLSTSLKTSTERSRSASLSTSLKTSTERSRSARNQ